MFYPETNTKRNMDTNTETNARRNMDTNLETNARRNMDTNTETETNAKTNTHYGFKPVAERVFPAWIWFARVFLLLAFHFSLDLICFILILIQNCTARVFLILAMHFSLNCIF